jgi:chromosome partitioning protein
MLTLAFVAQKGGSGKSTLSTHLAAYAEQQGETVALIDLDPQASALAWHKIRGTDEPIVLPATPAKLEGVVKGAAGLGVTVLMIDTAPHADRGAVAAIRLADLIVMPVRPSLLDIAALRDTVKLLEMTGRTDDAIAVLNALPGKGSGVAEEATEAVKSFRVAVLGAHVGQRNSLVTAIAKGKGVTEATPKDAGAQEIRDLWDALVRLTKRKAKKGKVTS